MPRFSVKVVQYVAQHTIVEVEANDAECAKTIAKERSEWDDRVEWLPGDAYDVAEVVEI